MNTIDAIYENGVFKPVGPVELSDGDRVQVLWADEQDPAGLIPQLARDLDLPSDYSYNTDHYLYGLPKQDDK